MKHLFAHFLLTLITSLGFLTLTPSFTLSLLVFSNSTYADWEMVGEAPISENQTDSMALVLNSQGIPYVAFKDSKGGATVMKLENESWQVLGTNNLSEGQADFIDLAVDHDGIPYVAYRDFAFGKGITVKKLVNNHWQVVGTQNLSKGEARFISLALDKTGIPYVAYQALENEGNARVSKYTGNHWEVIGTNPLSQEQANFISLALNHENIPYVAYTDWGQPGAKRAIVRKLEGQQWETVGNEYISEGKAAFIHLAFDRQNQPYVTYRDFGENEKVTVKHLTHNHWETVGEAGISGCKAFPFSLVLDQEGTPYVAYQCSEPNWGYHVYVKRFYNKSWNFAFTSSNPAKYPSLAFDDEKRLLYTAFSDSKASVMKREFFAKIELLEGSSLVPIAYKDSIPTPKKGTYFEAQIGNSITHSFVLSNTGDINLVLPGPEPIRLSPACDAFKITQPSAFSVNSLEFNTFKITFTPTQTIPMKCTVSITNNSHKDPYSFTILGVGTTGETQTPALNILTRSKILTSSK